MGDKISDKIYDRDYDDKSLKIIADQLVDRLLGVKVVDIYTSDLRRGGFKLVDAKVPLNQGLLANLGRKRFELLNLNEAKANLEKLWQISIRNEIRYRHGQEIVKLDRDMDEQKYYAAMVNVGSDAATGATLGAATQAEGKVISWAFKKGGEKIINKGVNSLSGSQELVNDRWFDGERTMLETLQKVWNDAGRARISWHPADYRSLFFTPENWLPKYLDEIVKDDFKYDLLMQQNILTMAKKDGKTYREAKNIQTNVCYQFWSSLKKTCHLLLQKVDFQGRMVKVSQEIKQLEEQLIRESQHGIRNARPV